MLTTELRPPISPGEAAPDFALPAVDGSGTVSLADYRGWNSVFLALFVGLWCPFCRRSIAQVAANENKLKVLGVETVGVVATDLENARLYFKFRPSRVRLGADPELATHRAYGLPKPAATPEFLQEWATVRINPEGDLPAPLPIEQAAEVAGKNFDGYTMNETDVAEIARQWPQLKGQFLVDREGIVRWANIECAEGLAGIGRFPSTAEILAAVRTVSGV
jgi:peroxiredoxin